LRNLLGPKNEVDQVEVKGLKALLQAIRVTPELADTIAAGLRDAQPPADPAERSANSPLMPLSVDQLTWLGIDEATVELLKPYVTLLPVRTAVNANTALKEVLLAAIDGLDPATAEHLVQTRQRAPFRTLDDVNKHLGRPGGLSQRINVISNFFEVRGRLRLEDRVLEESSLVERRGLDIVPLSRRRESSRESR
jgi:general secretion pathway protein K